MEFHSFSLDLTSGLLEGRVWAWFVAPSPALTHTAQHWGQAPEMPVELDLC